MGRQNPYKSIVFIVFVVLSISVNAQLSQTPNTQTQTVNIVIDDDYFPYSYMKDGKPQGLHTDIMQLVSQRLPQFNINLIASNWRQGLASVRSGQVHGVIGVYNTGKVRPYIYPYSYPLYSEQVVMICGETVSLPTPVIWPESFKNKLVLNIVGFEGWLNNRIRHPRFTSTMNFLEVPNVATAIAMVERGNADCSLMEKNVLANLNAKRAADNPYRVKVVADVSYSNIHMGYSLQAWTQPENDFLLEFARQFDYVFIDLKLDGTIQSLLTQYQNGSR